VSEIERDLYSPGIDQLQKLASGMGVLLADIIAEWEVSEGLRGAEAPRATPPKRKEVKPSVIQTVINGELFTGVIYPVELGEIDPSSIGGTVTTLESKIIAAPGLKAKIRALGKRSTRREAPVDADPPPTAKARPTTRERASRT
jgi:hypothetical protein